MLLIDVARRLGVVNARRQFFFAHSSHAGHSRTQSRSAEHLGDLLFAHRQSERFETLDVSDSTQRRYSGLPFTIGTAIISGSS